MISSFSVRVSGNSLIKPIKGLLDIVGVLVAIQLVIGIAEYFQHCVGIVAEVCLLGGFRCLQDCQVFLHIHSSVLLIISRQPKLTCSTLLLQLYLSLKAVLCFHHNIQQFIMILVPFFEFP